MELSNYNYQAPIRTEIDNYMEELVENIDGAMMARAKSVLNIDIDRDELIKCIAYDRDQYDKGYKDGQASIIRCKDCKWGDVTDYGAGEVLECIRDILSRVNSVSLEDESYFRKVKQDDFCSWAERKEDAEKVD